MSRWGADQVADESERVPYELDDPVVARLARFLSATPLADGRTTTGLTSPTTDLLAQSVLNWLRGLVWDHELRKWIDRAVFERLPDVGDVEVEQIAGGEVVRMTHRTTGVSALGMTPDEAWAELRRKVRENG